MHKITGKIKKILKRNDFAHLYSKMVMSIIAVFFIIILTMSYFSYVISSSVLRQKVSEAEVRTLTQIEKDISNRMEKVYDLMFNINSHYLLRRDFAELSTSEKILMTSGDFLPYKMDWFIHSTYIYYTKSEKILLFGQAYDFELFPDKAWYEIYNSSDLSEKTGNFIVRRRLQEINSSLAWNALTVIQDFPSSSEEKKGLLIANVNIDALFENVYKDVSEGEYFLVLDNDDNLITGNEQYYQKMKEKSGFSFINGDGEGYKALKLDNFPMVVAYVKSQTTGWKFIKLQNLPLLTKEARFIRDMSFLLAFLGLSFGVYMLIIISKKLYGPFFPIVKKILNLRHENGSDAEKNDFNLLSEVVDDIVYRSEQEGLLQNRSELMKSILWMIYSTGWGNNIKDELKQFGFPIDKSGFGVSLFKISGIQGDTDTYKIIEKFHSAASVAGQSYTNVTYIFDFLAYDTVMLLAATSAKDAYFSLCEDIRLAVADKSGLNVLLTIGSLCETIEDVCWSCGEAARLQKLMVFSDKCVLTSDDFSEACQDVEYQYPLQKETEFIEAVKNLNCDTAIGIIRDVSSDIRRHPSAADYVSELLWRFANGILVVLNSVGIRYENVMRQTFFESFIEYRALSRMRDMMDNLERKTELVIGYISSRKENKNEDIIESVKKYIDNNCEKDLSINRLGEIAYLAPTYLSTLFRDITGETPSAYILKVRIEKARELLMNSDYNVEKIAACVGYENVRTFFRAFKKLVGTTPNEYRKSQAASKFENDLQ